MGLTKRSLILLLASALACAPPPAGSASRAQSVDSEFLLVPGGRLYYEAAGAGPAIVLIHGGFGDRRMWNPQFEVLARDFRVVRYDHRGFGRSTSPDTAYSPVNDLVILLDHLGITKAHLVGNSMGGALALDFALLHPERVNRVVIVASGANGIPYTDADVASVVAVFRAAREHGVDQAAELWLQHPMIAVSSKQRQNAQLVREMVLDNRRIFLMRHWPGETMSPVAYERLGELRVPALFIVGDNDTELVRNAVARTVARVADGRLSRMANADHLPQLVAPEEFTRRVVEFLRD